MRKREAWPLLIVLAMGPWLVPNLRHYIDSPLYRDPAMASYAGWCLLHGQRMYTDFALPDGPFVYLLEALRVAVFGTSEHALRVSDVLFEACAGAWVGSCFVPRAGWLRTVTWALVSAAVWLASVLALGWWSAMQREYYYAGFGFGALGLVWLSEGRSERAATLMLGIAGFVVGLLPFGKHTNVVYIALLGWMALRLEGPLGMRRRLVAVVAGVGAATLVMVVSVAALGSLRDFWFWYVRFDLDAYRFFLMKSYGDILSAPDCQSALVASGVALATGFVAWRRQWIPRSWIVLVSAPMVLVVAAVLQHRGWTYHYIPAETGAAMCMLVLVGSAWCKGDWRRDRVATAVVTLFLLRFQMLAMTGKFTHRPAAELALANHEDLMRVAAYVEAHTASTDHVFYDGTDPVVAFAAGRLPAVPELHQFMFDYRYSLRVAHGVGPSEAQRERVLAVQTAAQANVCAHLIRKPAAIVVQDEMLDVDVAWFVFSPDPVGDLVGFCPAFGRMITLDYAPPVRIGRHRVFVATSGPPHHCADCPDEGQHDQHDEHAHPDAGLEDAADGGATAERQDHAGGKDEGSRIHG